MQMQAGQRGIGLGIDQLKPFTPQQAHVGYLRLYLCDPGF